MNLPSTRPSQGIEPLLVRPRDAWRLLGCGNTHGYELLNAKELESFLDGKARKITVASIHAYIGRKLAAARDDGAPGPASVSADAAVRASATGVKRQAAPRRRGRPRKAQTHRVTP